jgi:two-component system CheB/CheR fusion protein
METSPMARTELDPDLERLLGYLRDSRGFDFTGYKRASLTRRIQRRMQLVGVEDYASYVSVLEANPGEFAELFNTILINVTAFGRDADAWDYLRSEVVPAIAASRSADDPVRVWSAGTASGQEAYTLAAVLVAELGEDRFRSTVKIYATDVDEEALIQARHARYPIPDVVNAFGEELAHRCFEFDSSAAVFRQDLRRSLIFGRHDLAQDPPISRIDLLVCRNTLMYFTAEMQMHVLANFQFALRDGGHLFLGKSEVMVTRMDAFDIVNLKHRVFRRVGNGRVVRATLPDPELVPSRNDNDTDFRRLVRAAFEESPVAQLVIDRRGQLILVNRHARALFGIAADSAGRQLKDLQISYRPIELRSLVDDVQGGHRPVTVRDVAWITPSGEEEVLDISLFPLDYEGAGGVNVTFQQVGRYKHLRDELERSQRELESAYEELQSTVEELETTNEELQSTNEELETTNEELHSTNEELETMNEELQSTNEELETANGELRDRGLALDELNRFLESILGSLNSGVVVLNRDMAVRAWNRRAEDMWGLRAEEVNGSHFLNLDIGLPVDKLRGAIRSSLNGSTDGQVAHVPGVNRRGRPVEVAIQVTPLRDGGEVFGVILVMDAEVTSSP